MVHNGIEYALMEAYGEGFDILASSDFDLKVDEIAEVWRHGSVVRSWLLDLAASALEKDPGLERISGFVEDSGEGRWTVETAIDQGTPAPAIATALFNRFASRREDTFCQPDDRGAQTRVRRARRPAEGALAHRRPPLPHRG